MQKDRWIKEQIKQALERNNMNQRILALDIGVSAQAVSNWFDGVIPPSRVIDIANAIADETLEMQVHEYLFGHKLLFIHPETDSNSLAMMEDVVIEQSEREALDNQARYIMHKRPDTRTQDEWQMLQHWAKEFNEEIGTEQVLYSQVQTELAHAKVGIKEVYK
ncbi:helix-turn-helix transcriptional regulator [Lactobacillus sp. CC-MHH1034]|uniref:helix-turn-helix transcriptional regulator n=1 Tax=Agrilactobacillus fermenti TaxID=2586909 RepID=UPI001E4E29E5|nr:helix-turn-helix transcriptional regulator [Agrilactobacillus fermenti]MCD2257395.1 helix-turn-helix transcriptional regulator [Agrilactobacillus fermenti]